MAPSKTTIQESAVLPDPTSFPVPQVGFMQQLSAEYSKHKAAMEVSKKNYREKKDILKQAEWEAKSKSNELDDEIKKLQIESETLEKSEIQKLEAVKQEIEKETKICEEIIQERKHDAVHISILKRIYKDFPGAPK